MVKIVLGWLLAIAIALIVIGLAVEHPVAVWICIIAILVFGGGVLLLGLMIAWVFFREEILPELFAPRLSRPRDLVAKKVEPDPIVRTDEEALQEFLDRSFY